MKKGKMVRVLVGLLLVAALVLTPMACKAPEEAPPVAPPEEVEKPPVKIAGEWYTTGEAKSWGDLIGAGVKLAVEEMNEAGGIMGGRQIELTIYDEGTSADAATAGARKAINDGNVAVMGGSDASTIFVWQSVLREADIPYSVAVGSNMKCIDPEHFAYEGFVHPCLFPEVSEVGLLDWLVENRGVKTIALVGFDVEWGHDFEKVIRGIYDKPGSPLEIVESVYFPIGEPTCELETAKVVALNPDAIYAHIWTTTAQASFYETSHRLGYKGVRLIPPDCIMPPAVEEAGEAAEGAMETCLYLPNPSPQSKAFDEAFQAAYGSIACSVEEQGYEAGMILLRALDIAGTGGGTPDKLANVVEALHVVDWVTPRGFPVEMSKYGQIWAPELFVGIVEGGVVVIEATLELPPLEEWPLP